MSGSEMDLLTARRREGDASNGRTQTRENQDNSLYMRNCASLSSQRLIQLVSISLDFLLFSFNNLIIRFGCFQDLKGRLSAKIPLLNNLFTKMDSLGHCDRHLWLPNFCSILGAHRKCIAMNFRRRKNGDHGESFGFTGMRFTIPYWHISQNTPS